MKATIETNGAITTFEGDGDEVRDILRKIGFLKKLEEKAASTKSSYEMPASVQEEFDKAQRHVNDIMSAVFSRAPKPEVTKPSPTPPERINYWIKDGRYTPVTSLDDRHLVNAIAHAHVRFGEALKKRAANCLTNPASSNQLRILLLQELYTFLVAGVEGNIRQAMPSASFVGLIQELERRAITHQMAVVGQPDLSLEDDSDDDAWGDSDPAGWGMVEDGSYDPSHDYDFDDYF